MKWKYLEHNRWLHIATHINQLPCLTHHLFSNIFINREGSSANPKKKGCQKYSHAAGPEKKSDKLNISNPSARFADRLMHACMAFVAHNHMALCLLYARVIPAQWKIAERRVLDLDGERVYVSRVFQRNRAVADQLRV